MRSRTKRMRQYYSQMNNYESHKGLFQKPLKSKAVQKIIELKNKKFVEAEQLSKMTSYRDSRATGLGENSREEIAPIHDILNEVERPRRAGSRNPRKNQSIYELSFVDKKDKYGELKPILDDPDRPRLNISVTKGSGDNAYVLASSRQSP